MNKLISYHRSPVEYWIRLSVLLYLVFFFFLRILGSTAIKLLTVAVALPSQVADFSADR